MRTIITGVLSICGSILVAAQVFASPLTTDQARHLLSRTEFSVKSSRLDHFDGLYRTKAIELLLKNTRIRAHSSEPLWSQQPPPTKKALKRLNTSERELLKKKTKEHTQEMKLWWYREMLSTNSPLTEKMTLFWSNHFTSSVQKIRWPALMYQQNTLLRKHGLGNFRTLLNEVARDPAMLIYLDNARSRKEAPNENFARELLELFTLGEGHYNENDIKAAARALTGWSIDRRTGTFQNRTRWHDTGRKTFLGRTGDFDGQDIINIILDHPQVAIHITEKLWREFVSLTPDAREVKRLATIFRDSDYEIKFLLRAMLLSPHFWKKENVGALVKSPVELMVGAIQQLDLQLPEPRVLVRAGRGLGQDLFSPPNVKGWPGGLDWVDTNTLIIRQQILTQTAKLMKSSMKSPNRSNKPSLWKIGTQKVQTVMLPIKPSVSIDTTSDRTDYLVQLIMDPAYQLK